MNKEKYLIINGGSSSLKLSVYEVEGEKYTELLNAYVEKIGLEDSFYTLKFNGNKIRKEVKIDSHAVAVKTMLDELINYNIVSNLEEIKGVGHRVLHGGEIYSDSVMIDETVLSDIISLTKLGPLHHPGEIAGIKGAMKYLPNAPQIAVFDTAFHQTMPKENYIYPVPYEWYTENGVRRYGFHGTSHKYITREMQQMLGKEDVNLIVCHIGSGASICCVKNGLSYDTTMGLTPLDGLTMATRSGAIDPSILEYICHERGITIEEMNSLLNKKSGLLGLCGKSDCRDVIKLMEQGDENAMLAWELLKKPLLKYISYYIVELDGNVDAIIFTAGIGENTQIFREEVINSLSNTFNLKLNSELNERISKNAEITEGIITTSDSRYPVYVIPTNEEFMIINDTVRIIKEAQKGYQKTLSYDD